LDVEGTAPPTRRDRGALDTGTTGDTGEGDSQTGTFRKSTIIGAPLTVVSGLDMELDKRDLSVESRTFPRSVPLEIPKQLGPAKTFSVMILSQDLDAFSLFCRATVGKSGSFCIVQNCSINHQRIVANIKPGRLVVVKTGGKSAFLHPVVKADILDQGLPGDWLSTQETLETWFTKFDQVLGSSSFMTKVNAAALEITRDEERRAANFKTPRTKKRPSLDLDSTERIGISPYARSLLNGPRSLK
jgi:hypothetical protein